VVAPVQVVLLLLLIAAEEPERCLRLELAADWRRADRCWKHVAEENEHRRRQVAIEARYHRGLCQLALGREHRAERSFRWVVARAKDPSSLPAAHSAFLLLERRHREAMRGRGDRKLLIATYERIAERGNEQVRRLALDRIASLLGRSTVSDPINRPER
jgi:hypothetical protein